MANKADLCTPCAVLLREKYNLKVVKRGINYKVTCSHCNRRRYGATYEMSPIGGEEVKKNGGN